jgi:hypothetical protein
MSKYSKPACLFLFGCFAILSSGQVKQNFLDVLTDKFQKYCNLYPQEEIYVNTDRQEYVAGEEVWFSIYLIDRQTAKPSCDSRIAYFEILNPENRPVVQKRISLEKGFGPGQIVFPDTISSGIYTLRAYTNWMKNFMPQNCFSKRLTVHNALNGKSLYQYSGVNAQSTGTGPGTISSGLNEQGLNIGIDKQSNENIGIIINSTKNFRLVEGSTCYLFVQTHGVINFKMVVSLSDEGAVINVPRNVLIPGINHFTVFSASGKPVSEKLIFTPCAETGSLNIAATENLKTREKIRVTISAGDRSTLTENLQNLSISVTPSSSISFPCINDYMIFGSEFGVLPDILLKSLADHVPADSIDKLLLPLKSYWIDWDKIISDNVPVIKYKRETENHLIYGRLINKHSQTPDPDQYLFLSMPGKNATFQYAKTDHNGDFNFTIPPDQNFKDLIIQPENAERDNNIKIESAFSDKYPDIFPVNNTPVKKSAQDNSKLAINYQVMKIYKSEVLPEKSSPVTFTGGMRRFYGKPDIELVMDDYIKLPVMQEVFFELIPGVFMRKKKSGYEISISDPVENRIYDKPPILFIDGVVVKDPNVIANLDPEKVEKIDAIKSRYFVGDYLFFGMVNVITRTGDFSNVTLPDYAVRFAYRVTDPVSSFASPDYISREKRESRIPDFRNTLYWNPSVKTDKEGKAGLEFWTSDFRSEYEICVQGFGSDGIPVSIRKIIKVD